MIPNPIQYLFFETPIKKMVLKYPDLPEDEIVAIIGFDFIGDCYTLLFEHKIGNRGSATINDAQKLAPEMVREYIRQPGHKSIR